ncbi:MAG: serine/threonine protein phosphatase PrpC [Flavobacterium sp.]|jgi:serine/threonine protein phosphatase PrpC
MNLKNNIEISNQTDVGRVRDHNEDYISSDESIGLAVLADGMGGLNAGEVASSMSVHLLMDELSAYRDASSALVNGLDKESSDPLEVQVVKHAIEKRITLFFMCLKPKHNVGAWALPLLSVYFTMTKSQLDISAILECIVLEAVDLSN